MVVNKSTLEMNFRDRRSVIAGYLMPIVTVVLFGATIVMSIMAEERHH